ncbi:MAG: very short patch repair endonuclease [Isosphaeraceae bacterium]
MENSEPPPESDETTFGGLSRSELMSRVRSKSNKTTEIKMAALLRKHGLKGWRRHARMPGKPDFIWPRLRVAVFVDGCFWHGHQCGRNLTPKKNAEFWERKIATNRRRDARIRRGLRTSGWSVICIWECTLSRAPAVCVRRIQAALGNSPVIISS